MTELERKLGLSPIISKETLISLNNILKKLDIEKIDNNEMNNLGEIRNMIFRDGIITDNGCLVNIAYDFDVLMDNISTYHDLTMIEDITSRFDHMIKTDSWKCQATHAEKTWSISEKLQWDKEFRKHGFRPKEDQA